MYMHNCTKFEKFKGGKYASVFTSKWQKGKRAFCNFTIRVIFKEKKSFMIWGHLNEYFNGLFNAKLSSELNLVFT